MCAKFQTNWRWSVKSLDGLTWNYPIDKTSTYRNNDTNTQLMLSIAKPIHPVGSTTIARCLVSIMHNSGIDTARFRGHSTRSATTSAALQRGLSLQQILSVTDWSRESTFSRYYLRNVESSSSVSELLPTDII